MTPDVTEYLSSGEAAGLYVVQVGTLLIQLRRGEICGHKERGLRGPEWRVSTANMEAFGYRRRDAAEPTVAELERVIEGLRAAVSQHRRRADELDGRVGQLALENGRLRALLSRPLAGSERGEPGHPRVPQQRQEIVLPPAREGVAASPEAVADGFVD